MPEATANISDFTPEVGPPGAAAIAPRLVPTGPDPGAVESMVRREAAAQGVPPDLMANLAKQESRFKQNKISPKGAIGVMQLMPNTAKGLGVDPNDLEQNIHGGVKYYKQLMDQFGGDHVRAVAAYNAGPDTIEKDKGIKPETRDYVKAITGVDPGQAGLRLAAMGVPLPKQLEAKISDFQPEQVDYPSALTAQPQDETALSKITGAASGAWEGLKSLGRLTRSSVPDIVGAVTGATTAPALGPAAAPLSGLAAAVARTGEQAGAYMRGDVDATTAARNIRNTFLSNMAGQAGVQQLEKAAPIVANWVYRKLGGISSNDIDAVQAVADMVERKIPAGIGRQSSIDSRKAKELEGLNDLYDRWGNMPAGAQVPGLVRTGVAGQAAAQQGASYAPSVAVNKTKVATAIANYLRSDPTIPIDEVKAVTKGFDNFLGRMPEDMSLNDVRKVMNNVAKKVPFNDPEAVGKMAAQKTIHHFLGEEAANTIPDPADRAAFIAHKNELEKLINIENLQGFQKRARAIIPAQVAVPMMAGLGAGATGYYTHQDPKAAMLRGALVAGAMGATAPSFGVNLLQSPYAQQALSMLVRRQGQTAANQTPGMTPEDAQRIRTYLNANPQ